MRYDRDDSKQICTISYFQPWFVEEMVSVVQLVPPTTAITIPFWMGGLKRGTHDLDGFDKSQRFEEYAMKNRERKRSWETGVNKHREGDQYGPIFRLPSSATPPT